MARRVGIVTPVAFTGGVAVNGGVRRALAEDLGVEIVIPDGCQYTGALGAALLARELAL
jgi:activator of 2-hydroxyglutaryl-CoA dehydratase